MFSYITQFLKALSTSVHTQKAMSYSLVVTLFYKRHAGNLLARYASTLQPNIINYTAQQNILRCFWNTTLLISVVINNNM